MNQTSRVAAGILCLFVCCAVAWAGSAGRDSGTLILDESAYCRTYYQFGVQRIAPKVLKAEGEKVLGAALLGKLSKQVRKHWRPRTRAPWTHGRGNERIGATTSRWRWNTTASRERTGCSSGSEASRSRPPTSGAGRTSTIRHGRACGNRTESARRHNIPAARRKEMAGCAGSFCVSASRFPTRLRQAP